MSTVSSPSQSRVVTLRLMRRMRAHHSEVPVLWSSCAVLAALKWSSLFIQSVSDLSLVGYNSMCTWWIKWWLQTHYLSWSGRSICADWPSHEFFFFLGGGTPPSPVSISFTQKRVAFIQHLHSTQFPVISAAQTPTSVKNLSVSSPFFFADSNRPRYIHQNWTTITHRPESWICTGPNIPHFCAQTTARRVLHGLYVDCFVAYCDWYRLPDSHASPGPFKPRSGTETCTF